MQLDQLLKFAEYGISGLLLVMVYFGYNLVRQEQQQREPRDKILGIIRQFTLMCIFLAIVSIILNIYDNESAKSVNLSKAKMISCEDSLERLHTYITSDLIEAGEISNYVQVHYNICIDLFLHVTNE